MHLVSLKLLNFRNYDRLSINFSLEKNLIVGPNGMGKTNLIEAIYVLSLTKSFRGTLDKILIKNGKNLTKISGVVEHNIKHEYNIVITNEGKSAKIDSNKYPRLSDYISKINVVLFNPDDLRIIKDSPGVRRSNLNIDLSQLDNEYLKILNQYNKVLKQRNAYLKTMYANANASNDYLNVLTKKLIDYGMILYQKRKWFLELIQENIEDKYSKICGNNTICIQYISDYENKTQEELLEIYSKNQNKDMLLGKTGFGVHHDDYDFVVDSQKLKDYGSEGQQKNAIIAYKLSEVEIFKKVKKTSPILILDDLFSELDMQKIENILNLLDKEVQTFITTTDVDDVLETIKNNSKIIEIYDGKIKEDTDERSRT